MKYMRLANEKTFYAANGGQRFCPPTFVRSVHSESPPPSTRNSDRPLVANRQPKYKQYSVLESRACVIPEVRFRSRHRRSGRLACASVAFVKCPVRQPSPAVSKRRTFVEYVASSHFQSYSTIVTLTSKWHPVGNASPRHTAKHVSQLGCSAGSTEHG